MHEMLITEDYRRQNMELHKSPKFGVGGSKWVSRVINIAHRNHCKNMLDYGCGKGTLKAYLLHWDVLEYDPAIKGKDKAEARDLVICTDVLEHIEPELLDDVLKHLLGVTGKVLFFCISTKLAINHRLPDGRNPHLSFHDANWWKEKLSTYFNIVEWNIVNDACYGEAKPIRELEAIVAIPALDDEKRNNNVRRNSAKISNRLMDNQPPHDRKAVLVCYGPSLKDTWVNIPNSGGDIVTVSGAHQFLIGRGVIPTHHIDCDPRERKAIQFGRPHENVKYWMGSCVDPLYLEILEGHDVSLWHNHNGYESEKCVWEIEPDGWLLIGGGSVGLRAISLLYSQGYRDIEIHGMDCSFESEQERHAGMHLSPKPNILKIRCKDRWFVTSPSFVDYARQFNDDMRLWPNATIRLHGDGLLQYMQRS